MTSRYLPATARRVLAMGGEVRSRSSAGQSLQQLFRSQPFTQLKPFERLFKGDAASKRKDADHEPDHGTLDEVKRSSWHLWNRPSRGRRSNEDANR
jgi:hypothetical protein